jgi:hypothetical protein
MLTEEIADIEVDRLASLRRDVFDAVVDFRTRDERLTIFTPIRMSLCNPYGFGRYALAAVARTLDDNCTVGGFAVAAIKCDQWACRIANRLCRFLAAGDELTFAPRGASRCRAVCHAFREGAYAVLAADAAHDIASVAERGPARPIRAGKACAQPRYTAAIAGACGRLDYVQLLRARDAGPCRHGAA